MAERKVGASASEIIRSSLPTWKHGTMKYVSSLHEIMTSSLQDILRCQGTRILQQIILKNVKAGRILHSDRWGAYDGLFLIPKLIVRWNRVCLQRVETNTIARSAPERVLHK